MITALLLFLLSRCSLKAGVIRYYDVSSWNCPSMDHRHYIQNVFLFEWLIVELDKQGPDYLSNGLDYYSSNSRAG